MNIEYAIDHLRAALAKLPRCSPAVKRLYRDTVSHLADLVRDAKKRALFLLSAIDPAAERPTLRERVRVSVKQLQSRSRGFLTLGAVYVERAQWEKAKADVEPPLHVRLARVCPIKPTRQSVPLPFECGRNVLPGMERFVEVSP